AGPSWKENIIDYSTWSTSNEKKILCEEPFSLSDKQEKLSS
ncbi:28652_t:CDS:1, partial [Racocetra persica]